MHVQVLSDEEKRNIYDIYGKEGLEAGLEVGEPLRTAGNLKEEYERFKSQKVQQFTELEFKWLRIVAIASTDWLSFVETRLRPYHAAHTLEDQKLHKRSGSLTPAMYNFAEGSERGSQRCPQRPVQLQDRCLRNPEPLRSYCPALSRADQCCYHQQRAATLV